MECGCSHKRRVSLQPKMHYQALFSKIIDTIAMQMKQRFKSIKDFEFVELLDSKRFQQFNDLARFPEQGLQALASIFHV